MIHRVFVGVTCFAVLAIQGADQEIGGMHVLKAGTGRPVVVFEAGMGEDAGTWAGIQSEIARLTMTFAYDRAGLGGSAPSAHSKDGKQIATDLHALLQRGRIPPPYVLVGHSLGGAVVHLFAAMYPDEVAGLVLVDPEDGRLLEQLRQQLPPDLWQAREKAIVEAMPQLPLPARRELEAAQQTGEQIARALPLPAVPVVLLSGTKKNPEFPGNPMEQDVKLQLHRDFVARVPGAEHVLVPDSRHYIQTDDPLTVIDAIQKVIAKTRGVLPAKVTVTK